MYICIYNLIVALPLNCSQQIWRGYAFLRYDHLPAFVVSYPLETPFLGADAIEDEFVPGPVIQTSALAGLDRKFDVLFQGKLFHVAIGIVF